MSLDEMRLAVHPGLGLVARFERAALLVAGTPAAEVGEELIAACRSADQAVDRFRAIGESKERKTPAFFALVDQGPTWQLLVAGALKVTIEMEKSRLEFASTDPQGWLEETLRGKPVSVTVSEKPVKAGSQPFSDLVAGVVPGGAIELVDRGAGAAAKPVAAASATMRAAPPPPFSIAAEPAPIPAPAPPPAAAQASPGPPAAAAAVGPTAPDGTLLMPMPKPSVSEETALRSGVIAFDERSTIASKTMPPAAKPGTEVEGRPCSAGHLNDPLSPSCRVCGAELLEQVLRGPRPPLGRLVGKDGRVSVLLDRDYLLGRKAEEAPEVAAGVFAAVDLPASEIAASRVHAEIRIAEWAVLLTDRQSANGTFIRPAGVTEWIRLEPGHTVQIVPGTGISLGPYELLFDAKA